MDMTFRGILDLVCSNTRFAVAILPVTFFVFVWTVVFGPSLEIALSMFGLGATTAVIEFRREPSA